MLTSRLSILTRVARSCATLAAAAALLAGIAPECQAQVPPPNDNLANAQAIVGLSGSVSGTNLFATAQTNEPAPYPGSAAGASIWYAWTAPVSTTIDFNTRGSSEPNGFSLDTVLAVYRLKAGTNTAFTNLTVVAQNDDDPSGGVVSRVDFAAALGTLYLIQVDGSPKATGTGTNDEGYITLNWSPSLVGGTFQFTTSLFPMGAGDDGFFVTPSADISPSIHNPAGTNNGRITITRTGGYTGRCEMRLIVTNGYYTNLYFTNFTGTNIFITNYDATGTIVQSFTNIYVTNAIIDEEIANDWLGFTYYFDNIFGESNVVTDIDGTSFGMGGLFIATNLLGITGPIGTGPVFYVTNVNGTVTNVVAMQTNTFFTIKSGTAVTPSAIDGEDYLSTDATNITFDDFQMSKDVYLNLPGFEIFSNIFGIGIIGFGFEGAPPGPDYPDINGIYSIYGINGAVKLILTNVPGQATLLDPLEDPDIVPATISPTLGTSVMNVLNLGGLPYPVTTNIPFGGYSTFNLERATFRVNKPTPTNDVQTNTIWVLCIPPPGMVSYSISYTIDTTPGLINLATLDWNGWPTVAGSDYANPSASGLPDYDFTPTYTGVGGTINFPSMSVGFEPIQIVVTNNGAQEFDSDLYVQLYQTSGQFMANTKAVPPGLMGNIQTANFTINFNNPNPGVQPGGAWDRNYNPDASPNSYPPNNLLPGANQPVQAIAIQGDGEAIIGGDFTAYNSTPDNYVARLTTNGYLDFNFNAALGSGPNGSVNATVIDGNGRIYIGGQFTSVNGVNAFHIARLTPSGALDTSFVNGSGFNSTVFALAIDANGNILAGGDFTSFNTTNCNHIARLLPSGGLDTTFLPSSGAPSMGADRDVRAVATDSFGNVILGGDFTHVNGTNWNHIARLTPSGTLDGTFNPGVGSDNSVYCLAIQPNNYIILGGAFATYNLITAGSIARLTSSGALDT